MGAAAPWPCWLRDKAGYGPAMQPGIKGGAGASRPLRIAMVAPPWISIPAPTYGGIEEVVRLLCQGLVARGNHVTLFAAPDSESDARVVEVLDDPHPDQIEHSLIEAAHVGSVFGRIERERQHAGGFDVVHDHCPAVALAMADQLREPFVHTLHGPFDDERTELYRRQGHKATLVAISDSQRSQAPEGIECRHVVPNPIDLDEWPFQDEKDDELLFLGRLDADKGPHRAIEAALRAGRPLALAGPVQPDAEEFFASEVEPHLDQGRVRYLGSLGADEKRQALARARGLLMPIEWPEPFGLVMIEALATGTPVISFERGAAAEIVIDGENGFLVSDVDGMAAAIDRLHEIDPHRCRTSVERFDVDTVCAAYERVYVDAISRTASTTNLAAR
jgi:glycosyltransferase involved in cell wall biosynthesis